MPQRPRTMYDVIIAPPYYEGNLLAPAINAADGRFSRIVR